MKKELEVSSAIAKWHEENGIAEEIDLDEETVMKMTDHELLSLRMTELNPYEEEIVITEMNKRGYGPQE